MTFITPALAIAGVLAVSIPIIIHLLARQRRKPIEWAAMRFLIEAFRRHKRRLQLEQLILLAVRCLIIALLGLALARPILEAAGIIPAGGSRAVYLVIDDGMISGVTDESGRTALQRHVRQAVDLVNTLGPGDSVGVITAARPAGALLAPPSTDHGAVVNLLQSLNPRQSPTDLPGAFAYVRNAVEESRSNQQQTMVYLFSEFRGGSARLDAPLPATQANATDSITLFASPPAIQPVSNVQVVAIEPVRSVIVPGSNDGSEQVTVRLMRSGGQLGADVSRVRLTGDGLPQVEPKVVQWQPGQTHADAKFTVNFASATLRSGSGASSENRGSSGLTASIENDALEADNQRHSVLELRNQIRVLLIDRRSFGFERTLDQLTAGQWIRRALEPRSGVSPVQIVEVEPAALDVADVRTADVALLPRPDLLTDTGWRALRQFLQRDGLLLLMPPGEVNVHQWTEQLSKELNLSWRISLETHRFDDPLTLAEQQPATELLRLISSDLPDLARPVVVNRALPLERESLISGDVQPLLVLANGMPLVVAANAESRSEQPEASSAPPSSSGQTSDARGLVIYIATAPELAWTNLPSKPLMVPLLHELVRQGLSVIRAAQQLQVGEQPQLAMGPAARELISPSGSSISLDQAGRAQQPLDRAGLYIVNDQSNQPISRFAVNVDPSAGVTDVQSSTAVSSWLNTSGPWRTFDAANIAASLAIDRATSPIAGMLLMIVMGLVLLETILARRFSHAYRSDAGAQMADLNTGRGWHSALSARSGGIT